MPLSCCRTEEIEENQIQQDTNSPENDFEDFYERLVGTELDHSEEVQIIFGVDDLQALRGGDPQGDAQGDTQGDTQGGFQSDVQGDAQGDVHTDLRGEPRLDPQESVPHEHAINSQEALPYPPTLQLTRQLAYYA